MVPSSQSLWENDLATKQQMGAQEHSSRTRAAADRSRTSRTNPPKPRLPDRRHDLWLSEVRLGGNFANGQYNTQVSSPAPTKGAGDRNSMASHLTNNATAITKHICGMRVVGEVRAARGATDAEQAAGEKGDHDLAEMWVRYRNKNAGIKDANVEEKARVVIRGYKCDNIVLADGTAMNRETPTLSHLGFCVVMQIVASSQLDLFAADASSASSKDSICSVQRFAKQPSEGWPGLKPGRFVIILKGGFRYLDAPRRWWRHLASTLTDLGFVQMSLDLAIFVFYSEGRVNVIIGVHVDDIVGGFTKNNSASDKILADLRNRIDWGKRRLRKTTFAEKDAEQLETYDVRVGQEDYARSLTIPTIERNRASTPKASLTTSEETELRSMNGSLNWLAKETRIDLATPANLNQQGLKTVANLCEASRLIRDATKSADFKLTFLPTPVDQSWLTGLGDSSWANTSEGRSQGGVLIVISDARCMTIAGGPFSVPYWRTGGLKRRCPSTLYAENQSNQNAANAMIYIRSLLAEIVSPNFLVRNSRIPPPTFLSSTIMATDRRSLHDLLVRDGSLSTASEKRTAIDIACTADLLYEMIGRDKHDIETADLRSHVN